MLPSTQRILLLMALVCACLVLVGALCTAGVGPCRELLGADASVVGMPLTVLGSVALGAPLLALGGTRLARAFAGGTGRGESEKIPLLLSVQGQQQVAAGGGGRQPAALLLPSTRCCIYASHFLSSWGDRMWQFAVPLLFMEIFVDTLLPSALFSLALYLGCIAAMPAAGRWVDRAPRLLVVGRAIAVDNACILLSTALLCVLLAATNEDKRWAAAHPALPPPPAWSARNIGLFVGINVLGVVAEVMNQVQTLALERDWVVVLTAGDSAALAEMNRVMRRVDLLCAILAPTAYGFLMQFSGGTTQARALVGSAMVGLWNLVSAPLEYVLVRDVHASHPRLSELKPKQQQQQQQQQGQADVGKKNPTEAGRGFFGSWRLYWEHPTYLCSVAFCALWCTVLDNGTLMTAYLVWRGVPQSAIGINRGAGAAFGLVGTFLFPRIARWAGSLLRAGLVSVWLFFALLLPCAVSFALLGESSVSDFALIGCMVLSRAGLWAFDLAETQIMQEWVGEHQRGTINGMQTATYQMFYVAIQALGMVIHDPRDFGVLVVFSVAAVGCSAVAYTVWVRRPATARREEELRMKAAPTQHGSSSTLYATTLSEPLLE
jgi:solute carrier family 40 (iron-regulated transporter), member 1